MHAHRFYLGEVKNFSYSYVMTFFMPQFKLCIFFALPDLNAGTSSPKEIDLLFKQTATEREREREKERERTYKGRGRVVQNLQIKVWP